MLFGVIAWQEIFQVYDALSKVPNGFFTVAAAFGNVHGVYQPGNVKLEPTILDKVRIVGIWSNYSDLVANRKGNGTPLFQKNLGWWDIICWPDRDEFGCLRCSFFNPFKLGNSTILKIESAWYSVQGGPLPVLNGVKTPISRVISYNPSCPSISPLIGVISPYLWLDPICPASRNMVDGRNPKQPAGMYKTLWKKWISTVSTGKPNFF